MGVSILAYLCNDYATAENTQAIALTGLCCLVALYLKL